MYVSSYLFLIIDPDNKVNDNKLFAKHVNFLKNINLMFFEKFADPKTYRVIQKERAASYRIYGYWEINYTSNPQDLFDSKSDFYDTGHNNVKLRFSLLNPLSNQTKNVNLVVSLTGIDGEYPMQIKAELYNSDKKKTKTKLTNVVFYNSDHDSYVAFELKWNKFTKDEGFISKDNKILIKFDLIHSDFRKRTTENAAEIIKNTTSGIILKEILYPDLQERIKTKGIYTYGSDLCANFFYTLYFFPFFRNYVFKTQSNLPFFKDLSSFYYKLNEKKKPVPSIYLNDPSQIPESKYLSFSYTFDKFRELMASNPIQYLANTFNESVSYFFPIPVENGPQMDFVTAFSQEDGKFDEAENYPKILIVYFDRFKKDDISTRNFHVPKTLAIKDVLRELKKAEFDLTYELIGFIEGTETCNYTFKKIYTSYVRVRNDGYVLPEKDGEKEDEEKSESDKESDKYIWLELNSQYIDLFDSNESVIDENDVIKIEDRDSVYLKRFSVNEGRRGTYDLEVVPEVLIYKKNPSYDDRDDDIDDEIFREPLSKISFNFIGKKEFDEYAINAKYGIPPPPDKKYALSTTTYREFINPSEKQLQPSIILFKRNDIVGVIHDLNEPIRPDITSIALPVINSDAEFDARESVVVFVRLFGEARDKG